MPLRNLSLSDPPSRSSIWKMLAEAFGYFSGSLKLTDILNPSDFQETQVKFIPTLGHNHNGTAGSSLATAAMHPTILDLNDCQVALGRYFGTGVVGNNIYALLGGSGACLLGSYLTIVSSGTSTYAQAFIYGSTYVDFNPYTTYAGANSLDVRAVSSGYDSASFATNWTVLHIFPSMVSTATDSDTSKWVCHHHWGSNTTGAYLLFGAHRWATATTIAASSLTGTVYYDYVAVIKEL